MVEKQDFEILDRQKEGRKAKTINLALGVVRHILNLAAAEWLDEFGLTWLQSAPRIKMLPVTDSRSPYPLSWEEQERLFSAMPAHLHEMALFKVNTGCREQEVCKLRWEWEIPIPELNTSVFLIPAQLVKNNEDRLVVLNEIASAVIQRARDQHPELVFTYRGKPVSYMNNSAWQTARERSDLKEVRVHDLKHTFGRRLRAAGVSFEDRQDLLGHKSSRITTHYSAVEIHRLIDAANMICRHQESNISVTLLKRGTSKIINAEARFRKSPASKSEALTETNLKSCK